MRWWSSARHDALVARHWLQSLHADVDYMYKSISDEHSHRCIAHDAPRSAVHVTEGVLQGAPPKAPWDLEV